MGTHPKVAWFLPLILLTSAAGQRLERVDSLAAEGRYVEAFDEARHLAASEPGRVEVWFLLARMAARNENPEEARRAYEHVLKLQPASIEALVGLGDLHQSEERWAVATGYYRQALGVSSRLAAPHAGLGDLYRKNGAWAKAVDHYGAAVELNPKDILSSQYLDACRQALAEEGRGVVSRDTFLRLATRQAEVREQAKSLAARGFEVRKPDGPPEALTLPFRISFPRDKSAIADLSDTGRKQLEEVASALQSPEWKARKPVVVEGHACSCGPAGFNLQLGKKRAEAIRAYLIAKGVLKPAEVRATSMGESNPVASGPAGDLPYEACQRDEAHTLNRRVVVKEVRGGRPVEVTFSYRPKGAREFRPLTGGALLHSKDEVRVRMRSEQPVHAYAFHHGSAGDWAVLFPNPDISRAASMKNPLAAGQDYWIPGPSTGLPLDSQPGTEETLVYISPGPDPAIEALAQQILRERVVPIPTKPSAAKPGPRKTQPPERPAAADPFADLPPREDTPPAVQAPVAKSEFEVTIKTRGLEGVKTSNPGGVFLKVRSYASVKFEHKP